MSCRTIPFLRSVLLMAGLPALLAGCHRPASGDPRTDPPLVRTAVVKSKAGSTTRSFTGTVAARVQSDLSFRVSGKVLERLVSSGQQVRRGQLLMRLDGVDLSLALRAEQAAVAAAAARARQATDDETRDRKLAASGAISVSTYDLTKTSAEAARAQLRAVQAQAKIARNATGYTLLRADAELTLLDPRLTRLFASVRRREFPRGSARPCPA
jgi:multidrug efflux pump subunit AcrA (membrane-fusion protein)